MFTFIGSNLRRKEAWLDNGRQGNQPEGVIKGRSKSSKPSITQKRANQSEFWAAAPGWFEQKQLISARFQMSSISIFSSRDLFFVYVEYRTKK